MTRRGTRLLAITVVVAAVVVGAVFAGRALWTTAKQHFGSDSCTVRQFELDPGQAVGRRDDGRRGNEVPRRPATRAPACSCWPPALQESKLTNIPPGSGDRDSVGVLQQRPSQGWGKVAGQPDSISARTKRLTDVGEATKEFLDQLVKVSGWQTMPLAKAVQAVQISADGTAYAQHEPEAQALSDALRGAAARGHHLRLQQAHEGRGRRRRGRAGPHAARHHHARGRHRTTCGCRARTGRRRAGSSPTPSGYGIEQVDYAGRRWTRSDGWKKRPQASSAAVVATMYTG